MSETKAKTKADYIEELSGLHIEINFLKSDLKEVLDDIKENTEFNGSRLNKIAAKRAAAKLVEYADDLQATLDIIRE